MRDEPRTTLRVATYNIHKGVQGMGFTRRLEIHNIGHAVEQLDADIVCLQEVRKLHRREERYFTRWPELPQAEFLAPEGYEAVYQTNATTRHGEHGNALLSRWPVISRGHEDMSDHRFEQRGLLHVKVLAHKRPIHVIVLHLGLIAGSRVRQIEQLRALHRARGARGARPLVVAGDFNDWGGKLRAAMNQLGLKDFVGERAADLSVAPAADAAGLRVRARPQARGRGDPARPHLVAHVGPPAADRGVQGLGD